MNNLQESLNQDHLKLVESINRRVDSIYKQFCEFEESLNHSSSNDCGDTDSKIMDLLETLEQIQEAAELTRPYNLVLRSRQQALEEQIKCLEQSIDLMKLETGKTSQTHKDDVGYSV